MTIFELLPFMVLTGAGIIGILWLLRETLAVLVELGRFHTDSIHNHIHEATGRLHDHINLTTGYRPVVGDVCIPEDWQGAEDVSGEVVAIITEEELSRL